MAMDSVVEVRIYGKEIGKISYDEDQKKSYFQYNSDFLDQNEYSQIFPFIFKRIKSVQVFTKFENETFRGLPPMIADSLPDVFGNFIFKEWLENTNRNGKISPLEQLSYVANRGIGALEFKPIRPIEENTNFNLEEVIEVLKKVMDSKRENSNEKLNHSALLNIFKIGTSAGGIRPKILISEHKQSGKIIPGDVVFSDEFNHFLVKLGLDHDNSYNKEKVEYAYYLMARKLNINMMPSKLIEDKHFATLRFDRQNGEKQHVLTACGLSGWDFKKPEDSSYENLFKLSLGLKVPQKDINELYKRMIFNLVFSNIDDHLKNHSFIYNKLTDSWNLAPAYDLTYPLDALKNYIRVSRALSINDKRTEIQLKDLLKIADDFSIKNPKGIIHEVQETSKSWNDIAETLDIPKNVIVAIRSSFTCFL
jgi:serine/threonine-protein kinase HipA